MAQIGLGVTAPIRMQSWGAPQCDPEVRWRAGAPNYWLALATRRGMRKRVGEIVVLLATLASVTALWLVNGREARPLSILGDLTGPSRLQGLPGSPESAADPRMAEPPPIVGDLAIASNASTPFVALGPPARPFRFAGSPEERLRARTCLAAAMLYEAGNDAAGQLAVGQVVLNRVRHPAFPASVCGVVTQGSERATGCQFTFTCDGSLARRSDPPGQAAAVVRADLMLDGLVYAGVGLATHYHTRAVYPWWSSRLEKIAQVGPHLFFRWPGRWGTARAVLPSRHAAEASAALFARFAGAQPALSQPSSLSAPRIEAQWDSLEEGPNEQVSRLPNRTEEAATDPRQVPLARRFAAAAPRAAIEPHRAVTATPVLAGNRLLRMFPEEGVFFLELAPDGSNAQWRRAAELLCGGRPTCRVHGWHDGASAPKHAHVDPKAVAPPDYSYVRVPPSRGEAPAQALVL